MHCSAYTKGQLPVTTFDLRDVNLLVASEKGLKLHLNFYFPIGYLFLDVCFKTKISRTWERANFQWPLINRGYTAGPMAQFEGTFRWK